MKGDALAARLREAEVEGEIVPWRESMSEGPLPNGLRTEEDWKLRASILAPELGLDADAYVRGAVERLQRVGARAAAGEEIVLWFGEDLFDLANLAHLLDWLAPVAPAARLALVLDPDATPVGGLAELLAEREPVGRPRLVLARAFWNAISHADPSGIPRLQRADLAAWPALGDALRAHVARFPDARNLDAIEEELLRILQRGPVGLRELFESWKTTSLARSLGYGDAQIAAALRQIPRLVAIAGPATEPARWRLAATAEAGRVLAGEAKAPERERWVGGCRLAQGDAGYDQVRPGAATWRRVDGGLVRA